MVETLIKSSAVGVDMLWIQLVGAFFAIEGAANLVYWYIWGGGVKDNMYWQVGRGLRMALGLGLVFLA